MKQRAWTQVSARKGSNLTVSETGGCLLVVTGSMGRLGVWTCPLARPLQAPPAFNGPGRSAGGAHPHLPLARPVEAMHASRGAAERRLDVARQGPLVEPRGDDVQDDASPSNDTHVEAAFPVPNDSSSSASEPQEEEEDDDDDEASRPRQERHGEGGRRPPDHRHEHVRAILLDWLRHKTRPPCPSRLEH